MTEFQPASQQPVQCLYFLTLVSRRFQHALRGTLVLATSQSRLHDIVPQVFQQRPAVDIIGSRILPQAQTHTSTYAYDRRLMTGLTASNTLAAPWRYA